RVGQLAERRVAAQADLLEEAAPPLGDQHRGTPPARARSIMAPPYSKTRHLLSRHATCTGQEGIEPAVRLLRPLTPGAPRRADGGGRGGGARARTRRAARAPR